MFTSIQRLYPTNGILSSSRGYPVPELRLFPDATPPLSLPCQAPNGGVLPIRSAKIVPGY